MASSNEVLLVRHGETDDIAADRDEGRIDTPLGGPSVRGRERSCAPAAAPNAVRSGRPASSVP